MPAARHHAGFAHRMYLVDMQQVAPVGAPGGASSKFFVMGTTGNVYEVTIGRHSRCTWCVWLMPYVAMTPAFTW